MSVKKTSLWSFYTIAVVENNACKQKDNEIYHWNRKEKKVYKLNVEGLENHRKFHLQNYNCSLEYLDLLDDAFDGISIFNCIKLYSYWKNETKRLMVCNHRDSLYGECSMEKNICER